MATNGLRGRVWLSAVMSMGAVLAAFLAASGAGMTQSLAQTSRSTVEGRAALAPDQGTATSRPKSRPRTRIIVRPRRIAPDVRPPTNAVQLYPSPQAANFPGPGYKRMCEDWYEEQHRPSGTVIFPRMRCEWRRVEP